MRVLAKSDRHELIGGKLIDEFVDQLLRQTTVGTGSYATPPQSQRQTACAELFAYLVLRKQDVVIYVSGWSVWAEHLDLSYRYRRSHGEDRTLIGAPVHVFKPDEADALISVLAIIFYFLWDASIFTMDGEILLTVSHDEWMEFRIRDDVLRKECVSRFEEFGLRRMKS